MQSIQKGYFQSAAALTFFLLCAISNGAADTSRLVEVDSTAANGTTESISQFCVGADRAFIHLRPTDLRDLKIVHDACGFRYIRFHGLLNQEMNVVNLDPATGIISYNWSNIDKVYDALLKIGIRPFVELGFMPEPLASGEQTIFYYKGNTTPPKSYAAWASLVQALTQHLTDRYGAPEVKRWYFEIWNEPNLEGFWHGSQADYFRLYDVSSRAIKAVNPEYKVGGPATAGINLAWVPEFLAACHASSSPVDFVSSHIYGVSAGALDAQGNAQLTLDPSSDAIVGALPKLVDAIHASATPNLPLFISEWSTSYSARDPVHDSYLSAAYILAKLQHLPKGVDGMSYWAFSDQFEENGPVPSPFHGGFGLLNAQGLPKPAFYAYKFLDQLGPKSLVSTDPDSRAACDSAGDVQVLFWNFTTPEQDRPNQQFFTRDWPATTAAPVNLRVLHLAPGDYTAAVYRVGYRHNDVYTAYVDLGKPAGLAGDPGLLPPDIFKKLSDSCNGSPESEESIHVDESKIWKTQLPMNQNDVYLVTLKRKIPA